jgi:CRISPR-associated protein Csb2
MRAQAAPEEDRPGPTGAVHWIGFTLAGGLRAPTTATLAVGEVARLAAMAHYGRLADGAASATLSGKDGQGRPLAAQHTHAHYLPYDQDGDGWLDSLVVWVPRGLTQREVAACLLIDELRDPVASEGRPRFPPVRVELMDLGVGRPPARIAGPASVWRSATPFLPPRHPKWRRSGEGRSLVDGPEDQVRRELAHRDLSVGLAAVEPVDPVPRPGGPSSWRVFLTDRTGKPALRTGGAYGFRLVFTGPVAGPLALGYGCHFGLGLFVPGG